MTTAPTAPDTIESPSVEATGPHTNWARPAAFVGFGVGGAVMALSIVASIIGTGVDGTESGVYPGSYLMLLSTALTAAAGPVVFVGGRSARWTKSIAGSNALRITGWISYGVALLVQLSSTFIGGLWPIAGGLLGAGSLTCFGVDALLSGNEAADVATMASADDGPKLRPTVSLLRSADGRLGGGAVIGMSGSF